MLILHSVDNVLCACQCLCLHILAEFRSHLSLLMILSNHTWEGNKKDFQIKIQLLPFDVMAQIKNTSIAELQ